MAVSGPVASMRILFLSLEFSAGTFSGNGVLAQSQVRALSQEGHQVFVVSGRPLDWGQPAKADGLVRLHEVPVSKWGHLDAGAPWQDYAAGCSNSHLVEQIADFRPEVALGVDWTSLRAYKNMISSCAGASCPFVYLNYRVFSRTASPADKQLVNSMEMASVAEAMETIVLARCDRDYIQQHLLPPTKPMLVPKVLLPPLSRERDYGMMSFWARLNREVCLHKGLNASEVERFKRSRLYITCCVRLSEEKEPFRFVDLVIQLHMRGSLHRLGITPLLIGSATDPYAKELKSRLRTHVPGAVIEERFLGPAELASIYQQTRLNIHPCSYDAYGMTIVEAASQGAPSMVNSGGGVGATDLLSAEAGEIILTDIQAAPEKLAVQVEHLLMSTADLQRIGQRARAKACSWNEAANARELVRFVREALEGHIS